MMICKNCGSELKEDARFCTKCGAAQPAPDIWGAGAPGLSAAAGQAPAVPQKKRERKRGIIAVVIAAALVTVGVGCALFFTSDFYQCKRNMKQAQSCFEEGEYEDTLEYYEAALEIDDSQTEAYLQSADIYIKKEQYEEAVTLLEKGIKKSENQEDEQLLSDKLTEVYLQSADIYVEENQYENAIQLLERGIEKSQNQEEEQLLSDKLTEVYRLESDYYGKVAETFMTQVYSEAIDKNELKEQYPKFMNETIEEVCSTWHAVMQEENADLAEEFAGLDLWDCLEISGETVSKERIEQENLKEYQDVIIGFADGDEEIEVQAGYQITGKIKVEMKLSEKARDVLTEQLVKEMGIEPNQKLIEGFIEEIQKEFDKEMERELELELELVVLKCNEKTGVWKIDGDYIWNVTIIEGM